MKITIETLYDEYNCDTCGRSVAEGAVVLFDGKEVISMRPQAHCYEGTDYTQDMIFEAILNTLGHTLEYV